MKKEFMYKVHELINGLNCCCCCSIEQQNIMRSNKLRIYEMCMNEAGRDEKQRKTAVTTSQKKWSVWYLSVP